MNIIWHESPFIDSIYYVSFNMYTIEQELYFRGTPSVNEHIILNEDCALITFVLNNQVFEFSSNIICGKFTHPPKINIIFKNSCKKLTVIRLNSYGMFKLTNIPIESMVNCITAGSKISIDLSEDVEANQSLEWIEAMMKREINHKAYDITREIIHYIDDNFNDLPSNVSKVISRKFGISESTLLRYFKKYIGLNLSNYMVTLRRKRMIQAICNDKYNSLSAQENGYYDQSHFINDFKRLFGISLKEYFNEMKKMKKNSPDFVKFLYNCKHSEAKA
ncbi:MAG: AraC family transcriptional regulator [Sulfuricurvum sp.]